MFDGEYAEEVRKQAVMSVSERVWEDTALAYMVTLSVVMVVPCRDRHFGPRRAGDANLIGRCDPRGIWIQANGLQEVLPDAAMYVHSPRA